MKNALAAALVAILAVSLFANYYLYRQAGDLGRTVSDLRAQVSALEKARQEQQQQQQQPASQPPPPAPPQQQEQQPPAQAAPAAPPPGQRPQSSSQTIAAVAVRSILVSDGFFQRTQYEGVVMNITVDVRDGTGLVLVNTELPAGVDFQTSARTAVKVAQEHVPDVDMSKKDVIFSITPSSSQAGDSDLRAVDGPSAGAAMTVLLISELQSKKLDNSVLITGTIEPDGTIGRVGGVPEKAIAAGEYGAKTFLVPKGEATYTSQSCQERQEGPFVYRSCTSEQKPLSPATEERYGMSVVEVASIDDALRYL